MPVHDIGGRGFAGLSTDTKPSLPDGWLFFETDGSHDVYQRLAGAWTRILTLSHDKLVDVSATDHHSNADDHPEAHSLASHSSEAHSELSGVGADDHHAEFTAHPANNIDVMVEAMIYG